MKKKFLAVILVACMVCTMTACGKKEEASMNNGQAENNTGNNSETMDKEKEKQEEKKETSEGEEWGLEYRTRIPAENKAGEDEVNPFC